MFVRIRDFWISNIAPQKRIKLFCGVLLAGMAAALAVCTVNLLLHRAYYPYVTFLFDPRYRFSDFYETLQMARGTQGGNYFPFFIWAFQAFTYLPEKMTLYTMLGGGLALYGGLAWRFLKGCAHPLPAAGIFTLCSFPLLFALDRANTEILLFAVCAAFLLCYRAKRFWCAAFLLALGINMKLYPAVFLVLFAADKRYKELGGTLLFSVLLGAVGWWKIGVHLDFSGFNLGHQLMPFGLEFSHSFFNLLRLPVFLFTQTQNRPDSWAALMDFSRRAMPIYAFFALGGFALLCAYVVFINRSWVRAVLLLTLAEVFLPFVSHDYTLLQLALPVLMLLQNPQEKTDNLTVFLLALLFIPFNLPTHCFLQSYFDLVINLGSFSRPLIGLVLIVHLMNDFSFARLGTGLKQYFRPNRK